MRIAETMVLTTAHQSSFEKALRHLANRKFRTNLCKSFSSARGGLRHRSPFRPPLLHRSSARIMETDSSFARMASLRPRINT